MKNYFLKQGLLVALAMVVINIYLPVSMVSATPSINSIVPRISTIGTSGSLEITANWDRAPSSYINRSLVINGEASIISGVVCTNGTAVVSWHRLSETMVTTCRISAIQAVHFDGIEMAGCHNFRVRSPNSFFGTSAIYKAGFMNPIPIVNSVDVGRPGIEGTRRVIILGSGFEYGSSVRVGNSNQIFNPLNRSSGRIVVDINGEVTINLNTAFRVVSPGADLRGCDGPNDAGGGSSASFTRPTPPPPVPPVPLELTQDEEDDLRRRVDPPRLVRTPIREVFPPFPPRTRQGTNAIVPDPNLPAILPLPIGRPNPNPNPPVIDSRTLMPSLTTVPSPPIAGVDFTLTIHVPPLLRLNNPSYYIEVRSGDTRIGTQRMDSTNPAQLTTTLRLVAGTYTVTLFTQANQNAPRVNIATPGIRVDPRPPLLPIGPRPKSIGSFGDDVKKLQTDLISLGFLILDVPTGYFGIQTQAAVNAFQESKGWNPSGKVGYYTSLAIEEDLAKLENPATVIQNQNESLPPAITPKPGLFPISIPTPGVSQEPVIDIAPIDNPILQATPPTETTPTPILDPLSSPLVPITMYNNTNERINLLASLIDKMRELLEVLK